MERESRVGSRMTDASIYWDNLADDWRKVRERNDAQAEMFIPHLACGPGSLLLDAGCGTGAISVPLAERGYGCAVLMYHPG